MDPLTNEEGEAIAAAACVLEHALEAGIDANGERPASDGELVAGALAKVAVELRGIRAALEGILDSLAQHELARRQAPQVTTTAGDAGN